MATVHLLIEGKVQGVFFRVTAKEVADELGVKGWVKNTDDGNVEVMATGEDDQVEAFINWCKKGPEKAVVTNVTVTPTEDNSFSDFKVIRDQ